jgi:hypothetical protein
MLTPLGNSREMDGVRVEPDHLVIDNNTKLMGMQE